MNQKSHFKKIYIDFEFSRVREPTLNLVCTSVWDDDKKETTEFWLHNNPKEWVRLKKFLKKFNLVICYAAIAEARSYLSLGMDVLKFNWIDLFIEYRHLTNHNDDLQWGKQLVDGKVKTVHKPRPKWERTEEESQSSFRATHSLAEASYKLLGVIRDTKHKDEMRDLIISDPEEFTPDQRNDIQNYCTEDLVYLPQMWKVMKEYYKKLDIRLTEDQIYQEAMWRGRYAAHTAIMEHKGYPIDVEKTKNFSSKVGSILFDCQREINELFPDIKPFRWNKSKQLYSWNQGITKEWIEKYCFEKGIKDWQQTDKGDISLSAEAWQRYFDYKHDYPKNNFGAQMVRFLKLKQNLFGFVQTPGKDKKTFWSSVGSDGMVRPYMNIYGAQSSRSQPASTGFMFLKPAWMRALVVPPKGWAMAGVDYGSQEFFISALESMDHNMIDSYLSGDVYLDFGKKAGVIPADATKESHKALRDLFKSTVLGISYLMTKYGLAIKLTADSGEEWTEDMAQEQIDLFNSVYPLFDEYRQQIIDIYKHEDYFIRLDDGWYMWGDNENDRSVANVPIQGKGACIMRKSVDIAVAERKLYVPFTLHDANYILYRVGQEEQIRDLMDSMREGFSFFYRDDPEKFELAKKIKLDPFAWSPDYKKDSEIILKDGTKIPCSDLYIDSRSESDYNSFSKYFVDSPQDLL